jgi:D-sedoheptulose 7-phosphate isomerase
MVKKNPAWIKPCPDNPPPKNIRLGEVYYEGKGVVLENRAATYCGYFEQIFERVQMVEITRDADGPRPAAGREALEEALAETATAFRRIHNRGGRLFFVGNGGSAAIASHMATDYMKNGNVRSLALNDLATLTCFGNDFGYDRVFEKQLEYQARKQDGVVVISSSGRSLNIVGAAAKAAEIGCAYIVTLTGMNPNNRLRRMGNINYYVPCMDYGIVEIAHLTLLHSMIGQS